MSRDTVTDSRGTSASLMGSNRLSRSDDISAYSRRPVLSSVGESVPMHPRRRPSFLPAPAPAAPRAARAASAASVWMFHVTNSGQRAFGKPCAMDSVARSPAANCRSSTSKQYPHIALVATG